VTVKFRAILTLACTLVVFAAMAATAQAMTSKIDSTLKLTPAGVQASGPITGWEADEASAVVRVTITQGNKSDSGTSRRFANGATSWSALATGDRLSPGAAVGHATSVVRLTDGPTETYSWTVAVTLAR
jgi:hypothetical protein